MKKLPANIDSFLLPTAYLPPLEYLVCLLIAPAVTIELHETFPRQTWRNRCSIYSANGRLDLTIPVDKPQGNHTKTHSVMPSHHAHWQLKHWRSIQAAYRNAPFYIYYQDLLEPFYMKTTRLALWEYNLVMLRVILEELSISVPIQTTTSFEVQPGHCLDLRNAITPKVHRREKPTLSFLPPYHQIFADRHGFISNLSVVDLLFHVGPDSHAYLIETANYFTGYPSEG